MAKNRVDEILAGLAALRGKPVTSESREQIVKALANKVSYVVAKAADLVSELKLADLCPALADAFHRSMKEGPGSDKGCAAKIALARTALELECPAEAVFRAGIRHVQMEGSYGPPVDVAAELRGLCGLGLVQVRAKDVMNDLVDLLADPEAQARVGAVRALAYYGRDEGAVLLRFKATIGDADPVVIGECLTELLRLQPQQSLSFVERFLHSHNESVRDEAALALGSSREPEALEMLCRKYSPSIDPQFRQTLLTAIAGIRLPAAAEFLLKLVETERADAASEALKALRIYRNDSALRERVVAVVERRGNEAIQQAFISAFEK
jgi:HEAT repeat protein